MITCVKDALICMAKQKIKSIRQNKVSGYGLSNPWDFSPGADDEPKGPAQPAAGDYYGTGIKNPMGRVRDMAGSNPVSKEDLKKPPKSVV